MRILIICLLLSGCAFDACNQPHIVGVPGCETDRPSYLELKKHWKKHGRWKV